MATGLNDARAMRIAEVMEHFRTIQHRITQYQVNSPPGQGQARGYVILTQCRAEAQAVVAMPFNAGPPGVTAEQIMQQLRRVLLDASVRRFRAHKISLRAAAAFKWVQRRNQILQGNPPSAVHATALSQLDSTLNAELAGITNQRVYNELETRDDSLGNWVAEMPGLASILSYV